MIKRLLGLMLLGLLAGASPGFAQVPAISFEVTPYGGVFIPTGDVVEETDVVIGHKSAFALGGRISLGLPGPLGIEGNVAYALSDTEREEGGAVTETGANVLALSALLGLRFGLPMSPVSLHVNAGVAYIDRSGDSYDGWDKTSDIGGVVGVGARIGLPGILKIRIDAESYVYKVEVVDQGARIFESQFQADIVVSAGLVFAFM